MNVTTTLEMAQSAGVVIRVEGNDLLLKADIEPPESVIETIRSNKAEIVAFLCSECNWSVSDWKEFFEERAAIGEYYGSLTRVIAERQAFDICVNEWLRRKDTFDPCNREEAANELLRIGLNDPLSTNFPNDFVKNRGI